MGLSPGSLGARTHLRGHHALPLGDQVALLALAVPPHAEALVALERRRVAVVPASRALGQPRRLFAPGARAGRPRAAAAAAAAASGAGGSQQRPGHFAEAPGFALRRCPGGVRGLRRGRGLAECVVVGHGAPKRSAKSLRTPLRSEDRYKGSAQPTAGFPRARRRRVHCGGRRSESSAVLAMLRVVGGCALLYFLLARAAQNFWILFRMFPGLSGREWARPRPPPPNSESCAPAASELAQSANTKGIAAGLLHGGAGLPRLGTKLCILVVQAAWRRCRLPPGGLVVPFPQRHHSASSVGQTLAEANWESGFFLP